MRLRVIICLNAVLLTLVIAATLPSFNSPAYNNQPKQILNPDQAPEWLSQIIQEPGKNPNELDITYWDTLTRAPYPLAVYRGMSCVDDSGYLYAIGGQSPITAMCYRYSMNTNTWTALPSMPGVNSNQFAVWWKDGNGIGTDSSCIIVLGRYSPTYAKTCFRWTKRTNSWDTIAQFPGSDSFTTGTMGGTIGDTVYCLVRQTSTGGDLLFRYNVRTGVWNTGPTPPNQSFYYGAASTYGGRLWFFGGWVSSKTFMVYRPGTGWTLLSSPTGNIGGNSGYLAGHSGKIFAWGGGNGWTPWNGVAFYDTVTNIWDTQNNLPRPNGFGFYGAVIDTLGIYGLHNAAGSPGGTAHWRGLFTVFALDAHLKSVIYPAPLVGIHDSINPKCLVQNYGSSALTNIPVTCWIDSAGSRIYTSNTSVPSLAPGETTAVIFPSIWVAGDSGTQYEITMFTSLPGDQYPLNDTARATTISFPWHDIAIPGNTPERLTHGAAYNPVNDKIYMFGGTPTGTAYSNVNLCQEYDPVNDTWIDKATMPTAKGWIQGVYARGKIYAIGGYNNSATAINENACYDPVANTWSIKAPSPRARCCDLEAVWRDSLIYVMGGTNLTVGWNYVDIYNPFTNTWSLGTPMPFPGDMGDADIIGDTIYITNALNRGLSSIWPYLYKGAINPNNPNQIIWIQGPTLPDSLPVFNLATAAINNKVYWFGDEIPGDGTRINIYTPGIDTFQHFTPYPISLWTTQMVARTAGGFRELYVLSGRSAGGLTCRRYMKYVFPPVPPVHDVGCTKIEAPAGAITISTNITPACSVYNFGNTIETYQVRMKIGSTYNETTQVVSHNPETFTLVTFPTWSATQTGTFAVTCSTELSSDTNPVNDKRTGSVIVQPPATTWNSIAPIPPGASGKKPKAGSSITGIEATGKISFLKASNTPDFHIYTPDADDGSWLDITVPIGTKENGDGKNPKKGASIAGYELTKSIFMLRGSNTVGFWQYKTDTVNDAWIKRANIPLGAKRPKDASGLASVTKAGRDYIFAMKGSKTNEFYLYDIAGDSWLKAKSPPNGNSGKLGYKKGSCLCYDGNDFVYVLKGNYGDLFKYDVELDSWIELMRYDHRYFVSRDGKKKKPKDGAGLVYYDNNVYMLKGGNTNEFWKYDITANNWIQMGPAAVWDVPIGEGKRVKGGGCITRLGNNFYIVKGGNTNEFYCHPVPTELITSNTNQSPENGVVGKTVGISEFRLTINPNPAKNITQVRYTLPNAEPVRIKLYNVTGSLIKSYTHSTPAKQGLFTIDANDLSAGIYILRFESGKTKVTKKLVLEK